VAEGLSSFLDAARSRVDEALEVFLPAPSACPPILSAAMRYSVFAGGKRLRPVLALAAAEAVGRRAGSRDAQDLALPFACALELIHTYSLIHDDLPAMDNDTLRRGRPTLHVVYGDGIAILAGDGLQAEAFALVVREPATTDASIVERKVRALGVLAGAAGPIGMVGGQALDLQAAGQAPGYPLTLDGEGLRGMHARKTGALITASAVGGAIMAGGSDIDVSHMQRFGTLIGLAFQIVDDVLDVESDTATLGKSAGKDAASAKPSYPSLFGLERSKTMAADCVRDAKAALADAGLADGWLGPIADWIVGRRN
jgi:geranylgeranyl diphosphate synthase, type II